jgi:hypothetical protein
MNYVYGIITIVIGLFFTVCAFKKSEFIVYRILIARSKMLWKDHVHHFYQVVGCILVLVGFLFIFNIF